MAQRGDELHVTEGDTTLPAADVLTGRGFVTGKSGSGKSNTASVLLEELLDLDARLLVVDTDGEYYGLKEDYEVLHLGATDRCDAIVGPGDAEEIVDVALADGVPVVLDVSGFLEGDDADRLVYEVTKHLFGRARDVRQPFLLLVEEVHEFVPEQGGLGDVGEMLVRIAKRGRKRGLGLCGLSQRPASVDKDFITQCDWLVWHRLTWANDTRVVDRILGGNFSTDVETLDDGEAFLVADWEQSVKRVQFRRKRTYDAGATPGFGETTEPDLLPVPDAWAERFRDGSPPGEQDDASGDDETGDASETADSDGDTDDTDNTAGREDDGAANEEAVDDDAATHVAANEEAVDDDAATHVAANEETADDDATERGNDERAVRGDGDSTARGGRGDTGATRRAQSGGSAGGRTARTGRSRTRGKPATKDGKTAIWELGQLVAYVVSAASRRTVDGLYWMVMQSVRAVDEGFRAVGRWTRALGARALDVTTSDSPAPILPERDDGPDEWRPRRREPSLDDRLVGLVVVALVLLSGYAAYAFV